MAGKTEDYGSQAEEGPMPPNFEPYRPNEAFARVLAAKKALDRKIWPGG